MSAPSFCVILQSMSNKEIISYEDFAKLQMKTGNVLKCDKAENADKLYVLQIDIGEERPRQIVSSLADYYSAEELIGKDVVVLVNLKPAKMRGHLSEGMLLCAETEDGKTCVLLKAESRTAPGTEIT